MPNTTKHTLEHLKLLVGEWRDAKGPRYEVTLDRSSGSVPSCSVVTTKFSGETTSLLNVIRLGPSWAADKIMWGKSYVLEVKTVSRTYVRWVHVDNSMDFVWTRTNAPKGEPSMRVAPRTDAAPTLRKVGSTSRAPGQSAWGPKESPIAAAPVLPSAKLEQATSASDAEGCEESPSSTVSNSASVTSSASSFAGGGHSSVKPCRRLAAEPPKPHPGMSPAEAEFVPSGPRALMAGDAVLARFYGTWYAARVHHIFADEVEVLWDSEWCTSRVPPSEVVPRPAS